MDWVLLSLVSAVAFTIVTIVQKRTLDRYVRGAVTFNAVAALIQVSIASVLLLLAPPDWFSGGVAIMAVVGVLQALVWFLQSYALNREADVSRIIPILDSFPLFVLIIAVVFLGEALTPLKWAAAVMVIGGAIWASWHQALPGERVRINRSLVAMLGAMLGMSVMTILFKVASAEMSVVQMVGLVWLFAAPVHLLAARITHAGSDIRQVLRSRPAIGMVGITQAMMVVAIFSGLAAITLGPVSLATAIMGTRPVLLVIWVLASSLSFKGAVKGSGQGKALRTRMASASLVTVGIGVMAY